jgi:hypothetical protein
MVQIGTVQMNDVKRALPSLDGAAEGVAESFRIVELNGNALDSRRVP